MRFLNSFTICSNKENISPSDFEKSKKEETTGEEWWSDKFIYPNNWQIHSLKKVQLKEEYKTRYPILFFGPENKRKFIFFTLLIFILFFYFFNKFL